MATTNTNFKVKNGLDAGGNLTTTAGLQVGTTATVNGNFTTYGTSTLHANQQLSLAVRNGANYTGNILQYSLNDSTVTGGVSARGLIFAGSTGFENNPTYNLSATNPFLTSSTATFTVSTVQTYNPFSAGQKIIVSGASQAQYNGSWITTAVGGSSGAWTVTIVAPGTTTPFTNGGALTATGTVAVEPAGFFKQPSPGAVGLVIKGAGTSGSATDPFRYVDSAGNTKTYITAAGDITAPAISAIWSITSSAQDVTVNAIRARHSVANYRANLQTWENASTVLSGVNAQGQFFTGGTTPIQGSTTVAINTHTPTGTTDISVTTASNHGISVGQTVVVAGITPAGYNGTWVARAGTTGTTLVLPIGSNPGAITVAGTVTQNSQVGITALSANNTPLVVRGAASQAANLLEVQSSTGSVLTRIASSGQIVSDQITYIGSGATSISNGRFNVATGSASVVGAIIRGAVSQSADYFQIQNSAGTVQLKVDSGGYATSIGWILTSSTGSFENAFGGALLAMKKTTSTVTSPAADTARFFIKDGTTAGTLKLAARTGTAGIEETLIDNISSTGSTAGAQFVGAGGVNTSGTVTATGDISTSAILKSNQSSGDEGGQIDLAKSVTNTTLTTGVSIDVYQNKLRFFETGGTNRGFYVDISTGGASAGTNLVGGGGSFTGGTLTSNLTLAAGTTSLSPLTFQSGSNLTTVTAGANEYDGTVFYQTSNTNPGRALKTQNYYYASSSDYGPDFTASGAVKSMLGGATTGITVAAGTTYEYEFYTTVQHQYITNAGVTGTYAITSSTVSGSPTVAVVHQVDYGSNTTNFTTATTLSTVRTTGSVTFSAAISSGSRYNFLRAKGIVRVTGTGTAKIYPGLSTSQVGASDNIWTVQAGTVFKLTPIGNGTVTTVGAWS